MKIKAGALVTELSGSLAGSTIQRSKSGLVMHARIVPIDPASRFQLHRRMTLIRLTGQWRNLAPVEKKNWSQYMSFMSTKGMDDLSGKNVFQLFVSINYRRLLAQQSIILNPPTSFVKPAQYRSITVLIDISSNIFRITGTPAVPASSLWIVEATPPMSPGVSNVKNAFRIISYASTPANNPINIITAYQSKYGTLQVGRKIFVRTTLMNQASNLVSQPLTSFGIVVP